MIWKKLNYREPAVLRGVVTAVLALAASLGIVLPTELPTDVEAAIVVLTTSLPVAQALWTRLAVFSPKSKDAAVAAARPLGAPQRPGIADHAAMASSPPEEDSSSADGA